MGMFTRVRDIVNANINAALDKAEDPEKLVKQMIREMEDTLVEIKAACAGAMASAKKADRDMQQALDRVEHWGARAEMAVDRDREALAREALRAKQRYVQEAENIQVESDKLETLVGDYKADILQIEDKLSTARERQRLLVQRHIRAVQSRRAQEEIRKFDTSRVMVRFDEYEKRLDRVDAEAEIASFGRVQPQSLEGQFREIETDEAIEKELAEMKAKRKTTQPPSPIRHTTGVA